MATTLLRNKIMNLRTIYVTCLLGIFSCLNISAQTNIFTKEQLMGKKWTKRVTMDSSREGAIRKHGNVSVGSKKLQVTTGMNITMSLVFDKDSMTLTTIFNNDTIVCRYAYYLSDSHEMYFDSSQVGKSSKGNWLHTQGDIIMHGRNRTDEDHQQILTLTDETFVLGSRSGNAEIELTAEPLD